MADLVFLHGWAEEPAIWSGIIERLEGHNSIVADLGFFGNREESIPDVPDGAILVGHSLGFLWGMKRFAPKFSSVISVNGFTRFSAAHNFTAAVPVKILDRMISGMARRPETVVSDFILRCGGAQPKGMDMNPDRLTEGLIWLRDWDGRLEFSNFPGEALVLAGGEDPIVSREMTEACFTANSIEWLEEGSHLLPQTHPDWCAANIMRFLDQS